MTRRINAPRARHLRPGLTLVEMIMSITVFTIVFGVATRVLLVQSTGFREANVSVNAQQNLRFAADIIRQDVALAGANVPDHQPVLVYANATSFAFNADYTSNLPGNAAAVFVDPNAPTGQVSALTQAQRIAIPASSPTFNYPDTNYTVAGANSDAETIMFYFEADIETPRTDDFVIRRKVNAGTPELVTRGVLPYPGRPFIRYYRLQGNTLSLVSSNWLPLRHAEPIHLAPTDTGPVARVDLVRVVEVSYSVTNGQPGAEERAYPISFQVPMPNMGMARLRSCGDIPILGNPLGVAIDMSTGAPQVLLSWPQAVDEEQGERDVVRYVLWRRISGATDWGDPYLSFPAGNATYQYADAAVTSGTTYEYALAAQDCTPANSPMSAIVSVTVP